MYNLTAKEKAEALARAYALREKLLNRQRSAR